MRNELWWRLGFWLREDKRFGLSWKLGVKAQDEVRDVGKVVGRFPSGVVISSPLDEVLEFPIAKAEV